MILRADVQLALSYWPDPALFRNDTRFAPLWDELGCAVCGSAEVDATGLASIAWMFLDDAIDGHVRVVCRRCTATTVSAFDLSPIARFPFLAAELAGIDLTAADFTEKLDERNDGMFENRDRERRWSAGGVTIRLFYSDSTNHPQNEMDWTVSSQMGASLEGRIELRVDRRLDQPRTDDAELARRWMELLGKR